MPSTGAFIGGCITLFFSCAISAAGGVGGGGINVPILLLVFGYSLKTSIALSLCVVLGNAFAQTLLNIRKRHPKRMELPLIFWELVLLLLPAQMGGSNIGTILSDISPDPVIYVLAFVILAFASTITTMKGLHKWHEESAKTSEALQQATPTTDTLSPFAENTDRATTDSHMSFELEPPKADETQPSVDTEGLVALKWPLRTLQTIGLMWVCYTSILIGRVMVNKCSVPYVICYICMYIPLVCALAASFYYNASDANEAGSRRVNEVDLNANITQLICAAFVIGVVCSMLGIGGGELMSPLILSYHVTPQVTSATTAVMSFLNTFSNLIRSSLRRDYPLGPGMILIIVGFCGGLCGRNLGLYISAKYGRSSVIVFSLAGVLYLTCIYYIATLATTKFEIELNDFC